MKNNNIKKIIAVLAALAGLISIIVFIRMNTGDSTITPAIVLMAGMLLLRVGFNKLCGK